MYFLAKITLLITLTSSAKPHTDDSIGKSCSFYTRETWDAAAIDHCTRMSGTAVTGGTSQSIRIDHVDDGAGGYQNFWGNWRIGRKGDYLVTFDNCKGFMDKIYGKCGGYGGWSNTDFGTIFGECIRI
ncbi:hypothetical protein sscle_06g054810 [Sclerotinia sclerotiorum 1980 UF-70]|uniref:Cyanovirin-N domain-containing protein n=1 Tax=Sclerotinia sclerotiorum (strain ATCC 18683 / 1980 / Ss-1) TaxID=665079 RepID=A0A1D9Q705_SCLS1|nr:hypothetical protein sscle_06g054810 [Sclerotinia sclerotiorum 1980 UF-70]